MHVAFHMQYKSKGLGEMQGIGYRGETVVLEMSQRDSVKLNLAEAAGHFFPQPGMQVTQYLVSI